MAEKRRESAAGRMPLTRWQRINSHIKHVIENRFYKIFLPGLLIRKKYAAFQRLKQGDRNALELISALEEIRQKNLVCDIEYIKHFLHLLDREIQELIESIIAFSPLKYALLRNYHRKYAFYAELALMEEEPDINPPYVLRLDSGLSEELAGGKGAELSSLLGAYDFPVPPGLIITTRAFYLLLEKNGLTSVIKQRLGALGPDSHAELQEAGSKIRDRILEAEIPEDVEREVTEELRRLGIESSPLAMRSSAMGEDLQASFAGQFESFLNVSPENWFESYKRVIASKYSPHTLYYRMSQGFTDSMTPMAVLVMPSLQAKTSGILYTSEQFNPGRASTYMISGTGEKLAAGVEYQFRADYDKTKAELLPSGPGLPVSEQTLSRVFFLGEKLEDICGIPQDVEWLADEKDRIFIIQSRPLRMSKISAPLEKQQNYPDTAILAHGQWASSGQASGRISRLKDMKSIPEMPEESILVTRELPPELTLVLDRVRGVIAEKGSPACHFASVAREAGIPVICNVSGATSLENNQEVSIDTDQGIVLSGIFFKDGTRTEKSRKPDTPVIKKLDSALKFISPLNLQDPNAENFSIEYCKSLHDIVRYVHEAGVREMFSLVGRRGLTSYGAKRLESGIPLVMHVLDVDRGIAPEGKSKKTVKLEHVTSRPMQKLFTGLGSPPVEWNRDILHFDWDLYDRGSTAVLDVEKSPLYSSYAILDKEYLHALLRLGYHFVVIDALAGQREEQNYIHFSFKGGGGNQEQRFWRMEMVRSILEDLGFNARITADLLEGSFDRRSSGETEANLARLGVLIGKTALLDMRLQEPGQADALKQDIIKDINDFLPFQQKR
ncbi:MAG: PEP/pyruvate-binding domain-containing protein [Desulfobacterales bacterium]